MRAQGFGRPLLIVAAALWAAPLLPHPAGAEGAIALGQTDKISADGLAFGAHYNDFDRNRTVGQAAAECTQSPVSEAARKACKIIGTFHDQCFSLTQDAKVSPHGVGLALAENRKRADVMALDQCRKMARAANSKACAVLRNGCDGEAAFRDDPIDATGFHDRGFAYLNKRDFDRGAADFSMVIKLTPQNASAYDDRAAAYKLKGDLDHALADYEQAIALDPNYAVAYNNRGTVHLARKEFDLAIADFNQAIALDGKRSTPYINLGLIYDAKDDYDAAIAQFGKAIAVNPQDEIAYLHRGFTNVKKDDYAAAIADFGEAIRLNPDDVAPLISQAQARQKTGDAAGAAADIAAAKALRPDGGDGPGRPGSVVR
jgi:tetratricopeptide (TPR) repeat protein